MEGIGGSRFGQPRQRGIPVKVQPLSPQSLGLPAATDQAFAYAAAPLWEELGKAAGSKGEGSSAKTDVIGIAIEWPVDRRLKGKSNRRGTTVVWARLAQGSMGSSTDEAKRPGSIPSSPSGLLVPSSLFPRYYPSPLSAVVHVHDPIPLSLLVLQPVIPSASLSDSVELSVDDVDLDSCYGNPPAPQQTGLTNGPHRSPSSDPPRIFRQDDTVTLARRGGSDQPFRVLALDPVHQGVITATTNVIIATTPHIIDQEEPGQEANEAISQSSRSRVSLADFDPDAFLSSSLAIRLPPLSPGDQSPYVPEDGYEQSSMSSASGSTTPRPSGTPMLAPPSPPAPVDEVLANGDVELLGTRFTILVASGPSIGAGENDDNVCWMGVGGLGRAGIFQGDWVHIRPPHINDTPNTGRLVQCLAWEQLDQDDPEIPLNPIVLSPSLHRSLFPSETTYPDVYVIATSFGARTPTLPVARTITVARVATAQGVDKRYERSWLQGLQAVFKSKTGQGKGEDGRRMVKRGDIIPVPVWVDEPLAPDETLEDQDDEDDTPRPRATALAYFVVTALSYEPLVPLDQDFRSSVSSKARAGELGCWVDVGKDGGTRMVLTGVERSRVPRRAEDQAWAGISRASPPFNLASSTRLRNLLSSCFATITLSSALQLSILMKGARGSGKTSLVRTIADQVGFNIVEIEAYEIIGDTAAHTEGSLLAAAEKVKTCSPSIFLIKHIEALANKDDSGTGAKIPPVVMVLEDVLELLKKASGETGFPCVFMGTTCDSDAVPGHLLGCFKQELEISAPSEPERLVIARNILDNVLVDPDVALSTISAQSAALQASDIAALLLRAQDMSLERVIKSTQCDPLQICLAGLAISSADIVRALGDARAQYSDSIGAPKIPNVRWEDVGGLAHVKNEILETVQLPLERPELFAKGLKKRSGILLYGPPGTGKTLLAKAVATSCSLNFFSVKGPELLNMYIGESEANVRRVFRRARDASPCVVFMDELDSVAPKRGNQGDSGGVMDRIVSQLLAELDGMGDAGGQVFVMGATNRPDLLDPALLRPGRFDRMLYLSVPTTHSAQYSILEALTRKFELEPELDLEQVAEACPFNYTGADFYALCADAMLRAMTRKAEQVDRRIEQLNASPPPHDFPHPLTPQYYLSTLATPEEIQVKVGKADFLDALDKLVPSVTAAEMAHYARVQQEFKGYEIGRRE